MWQSAMQDIEARIAAVSQETIPVSAEGGSTTSASATVLAGAGARAYALALAAQGAQGAAMGGAMMWSRCGLLVGDGMLR